MSDEKRQQLEELQEERQQLMGLKREHQKRLRPLELKCAKLGINAQPEDLNEIEYIKNNIDKIDIDLPNIESKIQSLTQGMSSEAEVPVLLDLPVIRSLAARKKVNHSIPIVDRDDQKDWFRQILRGKDQCRGLLVKAESKWGKSTLLEMFDDESRELLPSTKSFLFEPSGDARDWTEILKETAMQLGEQHFKRYARFLEKLSAGKEQDFSGDHMQSDDSIKGKSYTSREQDSLGNVTQSSDSVKEAPFVGLDNSVTGVAQDVGDSSVGIITQSRYHDRDSRERQYIEATDIFIDDLEAISTVDQIVWLVDDLEGFDQVTCSWLNHFFSRINSGRVKKAILVVASNGKSNHSSHWRKIGIIHQHHLGFYKPEIIEDILRKMGLISDLDNNHYKNGDLKEEIKKLMRHTNYNPDDICSIIQSNVIAGVSDV